MRGPSVGIRRPAIRWVAITLLTLVAGLSAAGGRTTIERGNRLYRAGQSRSAADIYALRISDGVEGSRASYNLGTALIRLGSEQAERYLIRAIQGPDSAAAQRAHYNLGYRLFSGVREDSDPFSAVPLLSAAIDHNRAALRLNPTDEDARWNLALAVRAYSELALVFEEGPAESRGGEIDPPEEESPMGNSESEGGGAGDQREQPASESRGTTEGVAAGVSESLAGVDPGPLSPDRVDQILQERADDTGLLVRGILWSQRPDVRWWEGEPFPGGMR